MEDAIEPGHSGLLALVSDPGAVKIRKALELADSIVESTIDKVEADDIKAAAKEAEKADSSAELSSSCQRGDHRPGGCCAPDADSEQSSPSSCAPSWAWGWACSCRG